MKTLKLEWLDIPGYEGKYKISNYGDVYSYARGRNLIPCNNGRGYFYVRLCKNGEQPVKYIHRLVAEIFIPGGRGVVDHINRNSADNRVCNLRWVSTSVNSRNRACIEHGSSRFNGVSAFGSRWRAYYHLNGSQIHLGLFDYEHDAARAFDTAIIAAGLDRQLNFA